MRDRTCRGEENQATDIGNMRKKLVGDRTGRSGYMLTDRQADRHGHHSTPLPYWGRSNNVTDESRDTRRFSFRNANFTMACTQTGPPGGSTGPGAESDINDCFVLVECDQLALVD